MNHKNKNYTTPENNNPAMVNEPAVAERTTLSRHTTLKYRTRDEKEPSYDTLDAPCQYTIDEVKVILARNRQDFKNGKFTPMEVVNEIMDSWC